MNDDWRTARGFKSGWTVSETHCCIRTGVIRIVLAVAVAFGAASTVVASTPLGTLAVRLELVTDELADDVATQSGTVDQLTPVDMTPLGDGRQLILTLSGVVRELGADDQLSSGAYLDTVNANSFEVTGEWGPTSIAAHPGFLNPASAGYGKFYTLTNEQPSSGTADFGQGVNHQNVLTEWTVSNPLDQNATAFSGTSREILRVNQPGPFHDLFDLAFDDNGYLYVTAGDGGGTAYSQSRFVNAQDPSNVFGTLLRIDPVHTSGSGLTPGANGQYGIVDANFGASDGNSQTMPEAFAYGFRSPYRVTIDRQTGDVWIGDVGEGSREEIDRVVNGGNYGWGQREGTLGTQPPGGIDPLFELYHNSPEGDVESVTITGGYVYRGTEVPALEGHYVFADFGEQDPNNQGDLYYGLTDTTGASTRDDLFRLIINPDGEPLPERIYSIGEDENGELYLLGGPDRFNFQDGAKGTLLRIVASAIAPNGIEGDINQDGTIDGDDVAAFVAGWQTTGHVARTSSTPTAT